MRVVFVIDTINDNNALIVPIEDRLGFKALAAIVINFHNDGINDYDKMVSILYGRGYYIML